MTQRTQPTRSQRARKSFTWQGSHSRSPKRSASWAQSRVGRVITEGQMEDTQKIHGQPIPSEAHLRAPNPNHQTTREACEAHLKRCTITLVIRVGCVCVFNLNNRHLFLTDLRVEGCNSGTARGKNAQGKVCRKGRRASRPNQSAPFSPNPHMFANQEAPRQILNRTKMGAHFKTIRLAKVTITTTLSVEGIWGNENSYKKLVTVCNEIGDECDNPL